MQNEEAKARLAVRLGDQHGREGAQPYGDVSDGGSALLMDALGETEPTTEENAPLRLALVDAYLAAYEAAEVQS